MASMLRLKLFSNTTDVAINEQVEKATSDELETENWVLIMDICDKAGTSSDVAKSYLKAILKRIVHDDPHVGLKAVTLLDACVKNSGKQFHIEVASRDFENEFTKFMNKCHAEVAKKLREALKRWATNEFKSDPQLSLIPALYERISNAYDCSSTETPVKKAPVSLDPDVVESQEEANQIMQAIELSLKESGSPKTNVTSSAPAAAASSLYPSINNISALSTAAAGPAKEPQKVRALYDFEAAEDNELTFSSGEIIMLLDDSDANWWKGSNQRGEGLFPANFVTTDLSVEPEKFLMDKKRVQFKEEVKSVEKEPDEIEVNEDKINRLLHLLHEADPTNPETDTDELLSLERNVNAMGPLIDAELERVDRKHAQLTQLSADLVQALTLYHTLMREPQIQGPINKMGYDLPYGYVPPPTSNYNGTVPHMHHPVPHPVSTNYQLPPGLPQGMPDRVVYHPQPMPHHSAGPYQLGAPQGIPQHMLPNPQLHQSNQPGSIPPPNMVPMQGGPQGHPMGLPNFRPVMDDRMMGPYQGLPPPAFTSHGPFSQTNLQNGQAEPPQQQQPPQQPHFVSSSTHMMR